MEFHEIVVKDTPGLCRCCLSEGCYKDLSTEYTWMDEQEIYADMLLECFDISVSDQLNLFRQLASDQLGGSRFYFGLSYSQRPV